MPYFPAIGRTVAEIWRFGGFQNGVRPPSWIFKTFTGLSGILVMRHNTDFDFYCYYDKY